MVGPLRLPFRLNQRLLERDPVGDVARDLHGTTLLALRVADRVCPGFEHDPSAVGTPRSMPDLGGLFALRQGPKGEGCLLPVLGVDDLEHAHARVFLGLITEDVADRPAGGLARSVGYSARD